MKDYQDWKTAVTPAWKMNKKQILAYWQHLSPNVPLGEIKAIPKDYHGSTLHFDGVRVTGSPHFIDSILSRLKDLVFYENEHMRLETIYKQQISGEADEPVPGAFILYLQLRQRH